MGKTIVFSKHFGPVVSSNIVDINYYVEANQNGKWKQVDGPFDNRPDADKSAHDYAVQNHVATRVVAYE